jgi:hypothetical protein
MPHVLQHRLRRTSSVSAQMGLQLARVRAMSSAVDPTSNPCTALVMCLVPSAPRLRSSLATPG